MGLDTGFNKALASITNMAAGISNFTGDNATQAEHGLHSAASIVESIGSVAEDVNHFTRKQITQKDFHDVLQKLGKLIDKRPRPV